MNLVAEVQLLVARRQPTQARRYNIVCREPCNRRSARAAEWTAGLWSGIGQQYRGSGEVVVARPSRRGWVTRFVECVRRA